MEDITFASPGFFILFTLFVPLIIWYIFQWKTSNPSLQYSNMSSLEGAGNTYKHLLMHIPFVARLAGLSLLIVALARPQSSDNWQKVTTEGIDIMLAVDVSSSMLAQDFEPNRLEASKNVAIQFITGRPLDRMGLVVFSGESFTQCPLTTDHAVLINLFKDVRSGLIEDGTAIGLGLGTAVSRLKDSDAKSKVVILLTDGVNNSGEIAPLTAAEIAKTYGIRVYTVGVGTLGQAKYPFQTPFGIQYQMIDVEIDEEVLQKIAETTDGQYFRATNNDKLKEIYQEIDKLEKTKMKVKEFSNKEEEYFIFALFGAILLLIDFLLKQTVLRNIA